MIRVNIVTVVAVRDVFPERLVGLDAFTLLNLQTELDPVPAEFTDIEYWTEIPIIQTKLNTEKFTTEILTPIPGVKTVEVTFAIETKTAQEQLDDIAAKRIELYEVIGDKAFDVAALGFNVLGSHFDTSERGKARILGTGQKDKPNRKFKLSPGVFLNLSVPDMLTIRNAAHDHADATEDKEESLTALIIAATTLTELEAIDIDTGWPPNS